MLVGLRFGAETEPKEPVRRAVEIPKKFARPFPCALAEEWLKRERLGEAMGKGRAPGLTAAAVDCRAALRNAII